MNILIDTNIFIKAEPAFTDNIESDLRDVSELFKRINTLEHKIFVHPRIKDEIHNDSDERRRELRSQLVEKYLVLDDAPVFSDEILDKYSLHPKNTHDEIDNDLLAAVFHRAVSFLITEDKGIHSNSVALGIRDRVLSIDEALIFFGQTTQVHYNPRINRIRAYQLNDRDPIFDELISDYPDFKEWIIKCKEQHRDVFIVEGRMRYYCIAILTKKPSKQLKISTFKVSEKAPMGAYGDLLLRNAFEYSREKGFREIYLTVFPKRLSLIKFLKDNGFYESGKKAEELILLKDMIAPEKSNLSPFEFFVKYGPFNIATEVPIHIVPIKKDYYSRLFPSNAIIEEMFPQPYGNAIKKAYVCNAKNKNLSRGDLILFYISGYNKKIVTVSIVEEVINTSSAEELARFVGGRTIYDFAALKKIAEANALAILFRHAYHLQKPIDLDILKEKRVLKSWPQSIQTVSDESGLRWLRERIKE